MIPDDLALWRRRQQAGEPTPFTESLRFLAEDEQPEMLSHSYLSEADLAVPDTAANVAAIDATAALVTWVAEDEDESCAYGYWRGPQDLPLDRAPIVTYDSEGQFNLTYGANLSEALCWEYGEYTDGGFEGLVAQCRELGATITVEHPDDFAEPSASPTPGDHHERLFREIRGAERPG